VIVSSWAVVLVAFASCRAAASVRASWPGAAGAAVGFGIAKPFVYAISGKGPLKSARQDLTLA
jgi:hypothetical protein